MTASGQEPDEVTTGKPGGERDAVDDRPEAGAAAGAYDPKKIGDNHMPEDLREDEAARQERLSESD